MLTGCKCNGLLLETFRLPVKLSRCSHEMNPRNLFIREDLFTCLQMWYYFTCFTIVKQICLFEITSVTAAEDTVEYKQLRGTEESGDDRKQACLFVCIHSFIFRLLNNYFMHSFAYSFDHWLIYSFSHSSIQVFIWSLTHSFIQHPFAY